MRRLKRPAQRRRTGVIDDGVPLTPLAVLLRLMREKWQSGDRDGAAALARAAAPYMHPRRANVASHPDPLPEAHRLTDAELARHLALLAKGEPSSTGDPDITC